MFKIQIPKVNTVAEEFQAYSTELKKLAQRVENINTAFKVDALGPNTPLIKSKLKNLNSAIAAEKTASKNMGTTLESICKKYQNCEKNIINNLTGKKISKTPKEKDKTTPTTNSKTTDSKKKTNDTKKDTNNPKKDTNTVKDTTKKTKKDKPKVDTKAKTKTKKKTKKQTTLNTSLHKLTTYAKSQRGTREVIKKNTEKGKTVYVGTNEVKYNKWLYDRNTKQPWCAAYVLYCMDKAGLLGTVLPSKAVCKKKYFEGVANIAKYYQEKGNYKTRSSGYKPKEGDLIFFKSGNQNHIGIVTGYDPKSGTVYTSEGNSGDSVKNNAYSIKNSYIVGFGKNGGTSNGSITPSNKLDRKSTKTR